MIIKNKLGRTKFLDGNIKASLGWGLKEIWAFLGSGGLTRLGIFGVWCKGLKRVRHFGVSGQQTVPLSCYLSKRVKHFWGLLAASCILKSPLNKQVKHFWGVGE